MLASSNGTAAASRPSAAEFIKMQRKGGREVTSTVAATADNKPASKEKEHVVEKEREKEVEAREKQGKATEQKDKQPNYMDLFSPIKDVGSGGSAAKDAVVAGADGEASMMSMAAVPGTILIYDNLYFIFKSFMYKIAESFSRSPIPQMPPAVLFDSSQTSRQTCSTTVPRHPSRADFTNGREAREALPESPRQ